MNFLKIFFAVVLFYFVFTPGFAGADATPSLLGVSAGIAGIIDHHKIIFGTMEYQPNLEWSGLKPWFGVDFGYDLFYFAGGVLTHFKLTPSWLLTPSFGAGLYSHKGGIKLGSLLEFKTGLELSYTFDNGRKMGISFNHISNGGLDEQNPGTEIIKISYYMPLTKTIGE